LILLLRTTIHAEENVTKKKHTNHSEELLSSLSPNTAFVTETFPIFCKWGIAYVCPTENREAIKKFIVHRTEVDLQHTAPRGVTKGGQGGHNLPGAESLRGRQITAGSHKSPNYVSSTFFNTVHLLPKDLRFEHGGAKFVSRPRRHLTSLRP